MLQRLSFSPDEDIIARTRWYIHFRWFYIFALALPTGLSMYFFQGWNKPLMVILSASVLALISNGIFYLASRLLTRASRFQLLAAVLLLTDILIIDYLILTRGGVESRSVILYVIPIIMSAVIFGRKGIYSAAVLALASFNSIILADYLNIFRFGGELSAAFHSQLPQALYIMIFFSAALTAVTVAMDFIVRLLREKERQALETIKDLKQAQVVGKFGSWEWDIPKNRIAWSDEMYHMLGLAPGVDNLSFERYLSLVHPKDRRLMMTEINKAGKRPRRFGFDYRITLADGTERYVRAEGQSLADRSGRVTTIIGTARDITEDKQLDQSKNEFVSLASHQLRTPATVVKQYLNMLLDGYAGELTDKQRTFLKIAADTNDRQITIVNDLLGVAQLESGKIQLAMARVDLLVLVKALVEEYAPRAKSKNQTLSFSSRYKHLYCRADERRLRMVLENILDNALKYTLPHKVIVFKLTKETNAVVISVIDQGVGVADDDLPKLFKKFSRIEHPATFHEEGTGLGLYWAEKIVALHKGRITVKSIPGKGTTFKVILPMKNKSGKIRAQTTR